MTVKSNGASQGCSAASRSSATVSASNQRCAQSPQRRPLAFHNRRSLARRVRLFQPMISAGHRSFPPACSACLLQRLRGVTRMSSATTADPPSSDAFSSARRSILAHSCASSETLRSLRAVLFTRLFRRFDQWFPSLRHDFGTTSGVPADRVLKRRTSPKRSGTN
jgi:hypothetical protein